MVAERDDGLSPGVSRTLAVLVGSKGIKISRSISMAAVNTSSVACAADCICVSAAFGSRQVSAVEPKKVPQAIK